MDFLDICIPDNLLAELDVWTCLMCNKILGILTEEGTSNWIEHLELSHKVKDSSYLIFTPFFYMVHQTSISPVLMKENQH
jgi:hypothetical protein